MKIEIHDNKQGILINLPEILNPIDDGQSYSWAILPDFQTFYYVGETLNIVKNINQNISKKKTFPFR